MNLIKNIFVNYYLKKTSEVIDKPVNFDFNEVSDVLLIGQINNATNLGMFNNIINQFKSLNINAMCIVFSEKKKLNALNSNENIHTIGLYDFSYKLQPKIDSIKKILSDSYYLSICYPIDFTPFQKLIIKKINSNCKVGPFTENHDCFNLMIHYDKNDDTFAEYTQTTINYLQKLKTE